MIAGLFFTWFLAAALWTVNALRRPVEPGEGLAPMWLPGMLISELAPVYFVARPLIAWAFLAAGGGETFVGKAGFVLFLLSEVGLIPLMARTVRSARETGHSPSPLSLPVVRIRMPDSVEKTPEVPYWDGYTLDVYRTPESDAAPCLLYLHPGSWMRGRPGRQARPMFYELVRAGWIVLDLRYPLSPGATFPEHLVGVKRAIAWAKGEGAALGIDPSRVAVSGASSGAHLAALAALTANRSDLQPGFEEADTYLIGCVPFYGIYDLLVRNPTRYDWPFIARFVLKAKPHEAPDLYRLGSPVDQVHPGAPPFLVVHGEFDSVVLATESLHFVNALESTGSDVKHHIVAGAQHGFDAIASLRTRAVGRMCAVWLDTLSSSRH